jgi:hypothetical protein
MSPKVRASDTDHSAAQWDGSQHRFSIRATAGRTREIRRKARGAAGWLTAFRALIYAERGVFPGARNILPTTAGPPIQR